MPNKERKATKNMGAWVKVLEVFDEKYIQTTGCLIDILDLNESI